MKVLFLILNYKTYKDTILLTEELKDGGLEDKFVLIVDNFSPNEAYKELFNKYNSDKFVEVIQSPVNGGFAKGNNFGLRYAKKYHPVYVCIINNDVHFSIDMVDKLCEWYDKLPSPAFIAPIQKLPNGENAKFRNLSEPNILSDVKQLFPFSSNYYNYEENTPIKGVHEICMVPGAFTFVNYDLFENIGFFDEDTFLFCEERFAAYKAHRAGYKNYIILNDYYIHAHSTTINSEASQKKQRKLLLEGKCLYYKKYSDHKYLFVALLRIFFLISECYNQFFCLLRKIKRLFLI